MSNLFLNIIGGLIATAIFVIGLESIRRWKGKRPYWKIHKFSKDEPVIVVFPGRKSDPCAGGLFKDKLVTFEDMLAVNYVERLLTLSAWKDNAIQMREAHSFGKIDTHDSAKNLVLICSPRSNPVTKTYLDLINENVRLKWSFEEDSNMHLYINTDDGKWSSASYSQEDNIRTSGKSVEESTLDDMAIIIRSTNPMNPKTKVLIIAGIRGIGTWGSAKYLRQNAKELIKKTKGKDFACLMKIQFSKWRIQKTELSDICKIIKG